MSSLLREQVEGFESLFNFTIGGIEEHLKACEPEPDRIVGALLALDKQLIHILRECSEEDGPVICYGDTLEDPAGPAMPVLFLWLWYS